MPMMSILRRLLIVFSAPCEIWSLDISDRSDALSHPEFAVNGNINNPACCSSAVLPLKIANGRGTEIARSLYDSCWRKVQPNPYKASISLCQGPADRLSFSTTPEIGRLIKRAENVHKKTQRLFYT